MKIVSPHSSLDDFGITTILLPLALTGASAGIKQVEKFESDTKKNTNFSTYQVKSGFQSAYGWVTEHKGYVALGVLALGGISYWLVKRYQNQKTKV